MSITLAAAIILASSSTSPFDKARADIGAFCSSQGKGAACQREQRKELGYFVTMMAGFDLPRSTLESCMRKGKRGRYIDWTVTTPCLRAASKGRRVGS